MQTPGLLYTDLQTHIHTPHKSGKGGDEESLFEEWEWSEKFQKGHGLTLSDWLMNIDLMK